MRTVYSKPLLSPSQNNERNGIAQVVIHLNKHLPKYGYRYVDNEESADLIAHHAGEGAFVRNDKMQSVLDIAHCHGLYPTYEMFDDDYLWGINQRVISDLRSALYITVPSEWIADIIRRDMHINPFVVGWGVDAKKWENTPDKQSYILWNKNRRSDVCDATPVEKLAKIANGHSFVSTFGNASANLKILGSTSHDDMLQHVKNAAIYLATTKETFGIATLEAMAAGLPVIGFKHGATADLIKNNENGFLVEPGDYEELAKAIDIVLATYDYLSANAVKTAKEYTWDSTARQISKIYDLAYQEKTKDPTISVVIPCYNYEKYIKESIESVKAQETDYRFEIIVVNDGSTDSSLERINEAHPDMVINQKNSGVGNARNVGIKRATGDYIVCLDADDTLEPEFLDICARALKKDHSLSIAYTGLAVNGKKSNWPAEFNVERHFERANQIPTACMFRRKDWIRAGGYKQRFFPCEDANLWSAILSLGGDARQVTAKPLFNYRMHDESATSLIRQGKSKETNWLEPFTWLETKNIPFACVKSPERYSHKVRNYDKPEISVIIPVGPGHEGYLLQAIESVENQTFWNWEILAINDTGKPLEIKPYPFVRVFESNKGNVSIARNIGIFQAKGRYVVFLDADDILYPEFMERTLREFHKTGNYVYTDFDMLTLEGKIEKHETPNYSPDLIFNRGYFHAITTLLPRKILLDVLFDETMKTWEDVDLYMRLTIKGLCGVRVPEPLILYRYTTGSLRENGFENIELLKKLVKSKYNDYITGEKKAVCTCHVVKKQSTSTEELIKVRYIGLAGSHLLRGEKTRKSYGKRKKDDIFYIYETDFNPELYEMAELYEAEYVS